MSLDRRSGTPPPCDGAPEESRLPRRAEAPCGSPPSGPPPHRSAGRPAPCLKPKPCPLGEGQEGKNRVEPIRRPTVPCIPPPPPGAFFPLLRPPPPPPPPPPRSPV